MLGTGVYYLIVIGLFTLALRGSPIIVVTIFLLYPLDQWAAITRPFYITGASFTNILLGSLITFAVFVSLLRGRFSRIQFTPVVLLTALLFFYAIVTLLWTPAPSENVSAWYTGGLYILVFVFLMPFLINDKEDLEKILKSFLIVGIALACLILFYLNLRYRGFVSVGRLTQVQLNPLAIAQFGGYLTIVGALMSGSGKFWVPFRVIAIPLGCLLIIQSGSRGQFFAIALCVPLFYFLNKGKFSTGKLLSFALLAMALSVGIYYLVADLLDAENALGITDTRWGLEGSIEEYFRGRWQAAYSLIKEWLSSGIFIVLGLGNSASFDPKIIGIYPHIVPVEILGEEGLIGFTIYLLILLSFAASAKKLLHLPSDSSGQRTAAIAFIAFAVFEFFLTLKQGSLLRNWSFFAFVIVVERINLLFDAHNTSKPIYPVGKNAGNGQADIKINA